MKILIDRDMLLMDLYELRKFIMEAALVSDDAIEAKKKIDSLVQIRWLILKKSWTRFLQIKAQLLE